jgi:hypothetical protein
MQSPFLLRFGFPNIPGFGKKEKGGGHPGCGGRNRLTSRLSSTRGKTNAFLSPPSLEAAEFKQKKRNGRME